LSDIVERLRDRDAVVMSGLFHAIPAMRAAADEIELLRGQVETLRSAVDGYLATWDRTGGSEAIAAEEFAAARADLRIALSSTEGK